MGGRSSKVIKVTGDWLRQSGIQALFKTYAANGFQLFAVGGCVRNDLLGIPVSDIDMASDARPEQAVQFLDDAGFKVIPTGIDHGTLTVIAGGVPHEITTFRKDVETDGRHAVVAFGTDPAEDAQRRDFTINALYADAEGLVSDFTGGLSDIAAPIVRFIDAAEERIQEDYLRSLRFFRFHARFVAAETGFDPDALSAIAANLQGLETLSRERVGSELLKILGVPDPAPAVMTMQQCGVLTRILPGADAKALGPFVHFEQITKVKPNPIARLASIATEDLAETLRLSRAQRTQFRQFRDAVSNGQTPAELGYRLGYDLALAALCLRCAMLEQPLPKAIQSEVETGSDAKFPIKAKDLIERYQGPALGEALRKLEADWIASGFSKTKSDLLG